MDQTHSEKILEKSLAKLPAPRAVYGRPGVRFEIYRAHDLGASRWASPALKRLTALARSAYDRYGHRSLFDDYDGKSAVYMVRARTKVPGTKNWREEWLSIRMVPGDGKPIGVNEPEMFTVKGKPVHQWMKRRVGAADFWRKVASSSRMCGIHPYAYTSSGKVKPLQNSKHRYTPLCFALIHRQFVEDYPLSKFPYRYITAMIRPDFQRKGLSYRVGGRSFAPRFVPANLFLRTPKRSVSANRNIYSYRFPTYWFDVAALRSLVNRLRLDAGLPPLARLTPGMFRHLSENPARPTSIAGVRMKPAAFRALIDRHVPDAPQLKITKAEPWYAALGAMMKAAKLSRRRQSE